MARKRHLNSFFIEARSRGAPHQLRGSSRHRRRYGSSTQSAEAAVRPVSDRRVTASTGAPRSRRMSVTIPGSGYKLTYSVHQSIGRPVAGTSFPTYAYSYLGRERRQLPGSARPSRPLPSCREQQHVADVDRYQGHGPQRQPDHGVRMVGADAESTDSGETSGSPRTRHYGRSPRSALHARALSRAWARQR